ncbi:MAG TPA: hypothetical protein DDW20_05810 [Firmicutes bacterium]|nr:hypothetical protein [Bacillota bacterium]
MEVVVIEDEIFWKNKIKEIIESNNKEDKFLYFDRYDKTLESIINNKKLKIYLLDIELKDSDIGGTVIANLIREIDWKSIIIFFSIYNEKESIISLRLNVLTYVLKDNNFKSELINAFNSAKNILLEDNKIKVNINGIEINLYVNDILYITKEKSSKYCLIHTTSGILRTRSSLSELKKKTNFKQEKKHLLINESNVKYSLKDKIIFSNDTFLLK